MLIIKLNTKEAIEIFLDVEKMSDKEIVEMARDGKIYCKIMPRKYKDNINVKRNSLVFSSDRRIKISRKVIQE